MRGLWADERVDGKLWNLKNPVFNSVYRFFKNKELDFLQNADYTISLTFNAADEILSWKQFKTIPPKIMVIPCCADLELFNKSNLDIKQLQKLQYELNIEKEDFILLYLGSIGTWYMLDEMMEFFSILKQKKSQAKFLFVTKDEHERIAKRTNDTNARCARLAAGDTSPRRNGDADAGPREFRGRESIHGAGGLAHCRDPAG